MKRIGWLQSRGHYLAVVSDSKASVCQNASFQGEASVRRVLLLFFPLF